MSIIDILFILSVIFSFYYTVRDAMHLYCFVTHMQVEDRRVETEKRFISLRVKHESLEKAHAVAQQQLKKLKVSSHSCNRRLKPLSRHSLPLHYTDALPPSHTTPPPFTGHIPLLEQWVGADNKPQSSRGRQINRGKEGASSGPKWSQQSMLHAVPSEDGLCGEVDFEYHNPVLGISLDKKWIRETSVDWEEEDYEDTEDGALWYDYGDLSSMYTQSRSQQGFVISGACVEEEDGCGADDPALQPFSYPGSPSLRGPPANLELTTTAPPYRTAASPRMVPLGVCETQQPSSCSRLQSSVHREKEHENSFYYTCSSEHPSPAGLEDSPVVEPPEGAAHQSFITVLLVYFATQLVWFVVKGLLV